jgi:hypothetical protein
MLRATLAVALPPAVRVYPVICESTSSGPYLLGNSSHLFHLSQFQKRLHQPINLIPRIVMDRAHAHNAALFL